MILSLFGEGGGNSSEKKRAERSKPSLTKYMDIFMSRFNTSFLKSIIFLTLLILLTTALIYPNDLWIVQVIGGAVSFLGVFTKVKKLNYLGILIIAGVFFLVNINIDLTLSTMFLMIVFFALFVGGAIYLDELIRRDVILQNTEFETDKEWKHYKKKWRYSLIKNFIMFTMVAFIGSFLVWGGSINLEDRSDGMVFGSAILFALLSLSIFYILILKLPEMLKTD